MSSAPAPSQRPILVTGFHHSGTSWIGRVLAAAPDVFYVDEPLNSRRRFGVFNRPVPHWYTYIGPENEAAYLDAFSKVFALKYNYASGVTGCRSLRDAYHFVREGVRYARRPAPQPRALVKDPLALFASEWMADRFGCHVIYVMRHPAAFVASLVKREESHPFDHFTAQPDLMRYALDGFEDQIRAQIDAPGPPLEKACLLWTMFARHIDRMAHRHPAFLVRRHEDFCEDPHRSFAALCREVDIPFDRPLEAFVTESSGAHNAVEHEGRNYTSRNSKDVAWKWRRQLSPDQITEIKERTGAVWPVFYKDATWQDSPP